MMTVVTAAGLLLAALLAIPLARARTGDYFPPPALIVAIWCGTLGLYALRLLPYVPLRPDTVQLLAGTILLLAGGAAAGMLAGRLFAGAPASVSASASASASTSGSTSASAATATPSPVWARWTIAYAILGLAGTAWYAAQVIALLGWSGFRNGETLRAVLFQQQIPSTFLFLQFFSLAAALLAFALWLTGRLQARHLLLPAIGSLGTLITTDRTQTFMLLVSICFMATFHLGSRLRPRTFAAAALLVPIALVGNFILVGQWRGSSWDEFHRQVAAAPPGGANTRVWQGVARPLAMPYFYATASYPALDQLLHQDGSRMDGARAEGSRTGGWMTWYPIARPLERLGLIEGPLPDYIPPFVPVTPVVPNAAPLQTNAPTFLSYALEDYGPAGALFYALVVGVGCGLAWTWACRDRASAARVLVVGQMSTALVLTIFVNKFNNTGFWYVLVLTLLPAWLAALFAREKTPHPLPPLPRERG